MGPGIQLPRRGEWLAILVCLIVGWFGQANATERPAEPAQSIIDELILKTTPMLESNPAQISNKRRVCVYGKKYVVFRLFVVSIYAGRYEVSQQNSSCPQGVSEEKIKKMNAVDYIIVEPNVLTHYWTHRNNHPQWDDPQGDLNCRIQTLHESDDAVSVLIYDLSPLNRRSLIGCGWGR
ncbi:hypothetical protein [Elstera cyanobacteriorum]|uniref:hypothetical protein n=1 Tax=Elstera cyanobacteriorum TaxID=2022747 RepID=UPI0023561B34|nr:hypothetical protein [Elstera cyanobacteriorum]MCK6443405.1 hypothetical protein [Elstera cyanobacteriorum]